MHACITIRHCANGLVILNKVVLHIIVSETVKAVCKRLSVTMCGVAFKVLGTLYTAPTM